MNQKRMSVRFWTPQQCRETLKQCKQAGYNVEQTDGMTKIFDENNLVVSWLKGSSGQPYMVRVDLKYFI